MANGYPIIPSPLRVRGLAGDQQRGLSQLPPTYLASRAGVPSYTQLPQRVGESVMPSAVLTPQQRAAQATQRLAQLTQSRGGGADVMPVAQQRQRGFFDSLPSPMSPAGQGLTAAATTGLQLSGWQDRPITLGSALGAMGQAGMEAYTAAQEAQRKSKLDEAMLRLKIAEASKPDKVTPTAAHRNAISMGLVEGTPEYNAYVRSATIPPQPESLVDVEMAKIGAKTLGENQQKLSEAEFQYQLFQQMDQILDNPEFVTGVGVEQVLPFNRILAQAGMLTPEEQERFDLTQTFKALQDRITPMLRPVGSGSTSDFEVRMFQAAAPNLAKGKNTNRLLVKGAMQIHEYNRRKLAFEEQYLIENNTLAGAGVAWAKKNDKAINTFKSSDELRDGIENGLISVGDVYMSDFGSFHILSDKSYNELIGD